MFHAAHPLLAFTSLSAALLSPALLHAADPNGPASVTINVTVTDEHHAPISGAVLFTNEGGRATSDHLGRAQVDVALSARRPEVQLTAIASHDGVQRVGSRLLTLADRDLPSHTPLTIDAGIITMQAGAECQPEWLPGFGHITVSDDVRAIAVFDDGFGEGPALYVGGDFVFAGGKEVHYVARWNGSIWSALGSGMNSPVWTLGVFDDGRGARLYAGGPFTIAGETQAHHIAAWNGSAWSPVGEGMSHTVWTLARFDDGSGAGEALIAGGSFTTAGGVPANRIARWDGTQWSPLGTGMESSIRTLAVFDDGSGDGPSLYAGGDFTTAGGISARRIAKWNGRTWSALGTGMNSGVSALTLFDDGSGGGPLLVAGGQFTIAGDVPANYIASWNGETWSALGSGMNARVWALGVYDDGSAEGPALYAGGLFMEAGGAPISYLAKWNGRSWSDPGHIMNSLVRSLIVGDLGNGPVLYAGGSSTSNSQTFIAGWDGTNWRAIRDGISGTVNALKVFDDGDGPALFVAGNFLVAGATTVNRIARWDGQSWRPLGSGLGEPVNQPVYALAIFDDGNGPALYAGGNFTVAGDVTVNRIARWDGTAWHPLGSGMNDIVQSLFVYDDGSGDGPALYAGGDFTTAGGTPAMRIARWNGTEWSALGFGVNGTVYAMTDFDDGSGNGSTLYVGGNFIGAGGTVVNSVARWNGTTWSALGAGFGTEFGSPSVRALVVHDDGFGEGPALFAGGLFTSAGGITVRNVARWNGSAWSSTGDGVEGGVRCLVVIDDGSEERPSLLAGRTISVPWQTPADLIARWDGASWTLLDTAIAGEIGPAVNDIIRFDGGEEPGLFAAGFFNAAGGVASRGLAKRAICPPASIPCPADLNGDGSVDLADLLIMLSAWGSCNTCAADINGDGTVDLADLLFLLAEWGACS